MTRHQRLAARIVTGASAAFALLVLADAAFIAVYRCHENCGSQPLGRPAWLFERDSWRWNAQLVLAVVGFVGCAVAAWAAWRSRPVLCAVALGTGMIPLIVWLSWVT